MCDSDEDGGDGGDVTNDQSKQHDDTGYNSEKGDGTSKSNGSTTGRKGIACACSKKVAFVRSMQHPHIIIVIGPRHPANGYKERRTKVIRERTASITFVGYFHSSIVRLL